MNQSTRRSGMTLMAMGLLGAVFFWALDPRWGVIRFLRPSSETANPIDDANHAIAGTVVGVVGSLVIMLLGVWLVSRRRV